MVSMLSLAITRVALSATGLKMVRSRFRCTEVTIAGNLLDLYGQIVAIGDDQDLRGGIRCGSVLVDSMKIAGT